MPQKGEKEMATTGRTEARPRVAHARSVTQRTAKRMLPAMTAEISAFCASVLGITVGLNSRSSCGGRDGEGGREE
jgi:hypothetical protein